MNFIIKRKWFVLVAWIVFATVLFLVAPNMGELVREKGQIKVPDEYSSALAGEILKDVQSQEGGENETTVALVFHNPDELTSEDVKEAEKAIRTLEEHEEELGITNILTHFNEDTLKEQLVSEDGKAILASVSLKWEDREPKELKEALYSILEDVKVDHYFTSEWLVNEDLMNSSQEGVKKTEGITVAFIVVVLLLVFRSFIAPFIPLITVGFSYVASQSIVSFLVDKFDFPISTYTQIFLVAILFGIGTDYCILLLSRFKEELTQKETVAEAILVTYRNAGRTVFFSGLAVMIGFAAIGISQFILYQSAAAVAVGVAVLLIALFTVVPFFMAVLGQKLFWPSKSKAEHGDSKLWTMAGKFSLSRPFVSLLVVAAICVPFLISYDGDLSYDSMEEISGDVGSLQAFNAISGSFSPGEAMPTQVVVKNDEEMDSVEYIALVDQITKELEKVDHVQTVRSITMPAGEPIEDFLVAKQAQDLGDGIGAGKDGLTKISDGLQEASDELSKSAPELNKATDGINELITGTGQLQSGLAEIQTNLDKIENGIRQGSAGSTELSNGLKQAKVGVEQLLDTYRSQLLSNYELMGKNLSQLSSGYQQIGAGMTGLSDATGQLFNHLDSNYPALAVDQQYQVWKGTINATLQGIPNQQAGLIDSINQLNSGIAGINDGMTQANAGFDQALQKGKNELGSGLQQLIEGIEAQQAGLNQLADGQGMIVDNIPQLTNGIAGVNDGQKQLLDGFGQIGGQLTQLTDGLEQSADGLNQVSDGLQSAQDYLSGLSEADEMSGIYLPAEVLESEDFAQVLDTYMSEDRKVMTFDVIFEESPYSNEAIAQVENIKEAVKRATKDTKLENAVVALGGITSTNADLDTVSGKDYTRTVVYMLIGISIILVFLFRSLIMPLYIIGSLILTFFTTMAINEVIFVNILGYAGISWAVPFFAFVILIALGVDYSIFLMDRFNEYKDLTVTQAMFMAMKKMGTVIISAAIILGGTFAAMMPSGMLSLLQIASITIVGLLLYAFVVLPLFIPVMVKNFGEANWWPFKRIDQ
ncbi:MMPL family transporter [Robertmurraya yapensis]|uniref:MMPL family transporter n=1 Tax=Bacillus yapensis TaxID=2492960 RepID=A0A3S0KHT3_9BACI|nr:MMPL family transporter [Bacillus yapensis]RTR27119.1 MMPL family transporter [Bacillus yapensis]TKS93966.1 MMPL family transporter [Bacillus yapensis]